MLVSLLAPKSFTQPQLSCCRCLLAIIAVRLAFNAVLSSAASRLAQGRGRDPAHKDGRKLLEEVWVLCGNLLMLSLAFFVMMKRNGRCWFGNVEKCIVGWPIHDIDPATALYYNLEMAWYGHLLLKPVLGYGLADGRDMMAHHCVSVALLMASYGLNLHRIGESSCCRLCSCPSQSHVSHLFVAQQSITRTRSD